MIEEQRKLFEEWKKECPGIVTDGVVNEKAYKAAPRKLLYLMKEVNGGEGAGICVNSLPMVGDQGLGTILPVGQWEYIV